MIYRILATILLAFVLTACGFGGRQENAGINFVEFTWSDNEIGARMPKRVEITHGQELGAIDFSFKMPDGTVLNFAAEDVRAFEGQRIRAEVEKQFYENMFSAIKEVAPGALEAIIKAIVPIPSIPVPETPPEPPE